MNEPIEEITEIAPGPEMHKKPILAWLAKSIFVDSIVELFKGIGHFFAVHIKLLLDSFRFVWVPFYKGTRTEAEELMNRSQAVFGFLLTVLGFLIFLVKLNVIEEPSKEFMDALGNEQTGLIMNVMFFVILAASYFILQVILVLFGRLYRYIAKPTPNIASNDMLFVHMGNQAFILGSLGGLIMRMIHNNDTIDSENDTAIVWMIAFAFFTVLYIIIFSRLLWKEKKAAILKRIIYITAVSIFHALIAGLIVTMLIFFYIGI